MIGECAGICLKSLNYQLLCIEYEIMINKDEFAQKLERTIEIPMIVLAIIIIPIVFIELEILSTNAQIVSIATMIDDIIWFAFLFEYIILVSLYNDKIGYTKRSWLNLLILLLSPPLIAPQGFASIRALRALRIFRVFRSLRILIALKRGIKPILEVFEKNSLHYVTIITGFLIIASSIAFSWLEQRDLSSGLWWAITTVTTVGYGDTYPVTNMGRIFAVLVMIIGIGFVSLLTANIASYFVEKDIENEKTDKTDSNQLILERIEVLSKKIDEINRKLP